MISRLGYAETRKYKHVQLKSLICSIENDLTELNSNVLAPDQTKKRLKEVQEMFFEIALRLD
jgi:hypothetical protein